MRQNLFIGLVFLLTLLTFPTFAQEAATEVVPEATETVTQNARDLLRGAGHLHAAGRLGRRIDYADKQFGGANDASSKETLNKYASLLDPDESSVIIGVFDRTSFAESMNVAADADISTLLNGLLNAPTSLKFTLSEIAPMTIGGHAAAQVSGSIESGIRRCDFDRVR